MSEPIKKNCETIHVGVNWAQKIEQYTDGYLALYRMEPHPIHEAVIHLTETVHQ